MNVGPPYYCRECGSPFTSARYLRDHYNTIHRGDRFRCTNPDCRREFKTTAMFYSHRGLNCADFNFFRVIGTGSQQGAAHVAAVEAEERRQQDAARSAPARSTSANVASPLAHSSTEPPSSFGGSSSSGYRTGFRSAVRHQAPASTVGPFGVDVGRTMREYEEATSSHQRLTRSVLAATGARMEGGRMVLDSRTDDKKNVKTKEKKSKQTK